LASVGDSLTAGTQDANTVQDRQRFAYGQQIANVTGMRYNMGLIGGEGLPFTVFGDVGFDQAKFASKRSRLIRAIAPLALYTYYVGQLPFVPPVWELLGLGSRTPESRNTPERPQTNFAVPSFEARHLLGVKGVGDLLNEMHMGVEKVDGLASTIPWAKALLQNGGRRRVGSEIDQVVKTKPDIVTLWAGNNDALSTVFESRIDDRTLTPVEDRVWTFKDYDLITGRPKIRTTDRVLPGFKSTIDSILDRLLGETDAEVVLMNIPDVTVIPILKTMGQPVGTLPFRVYLKDGSDVTHEVERWVIPDNREDGTRYPPGSRVNLISVLDKFLSRGEVKDRSGLYKAMTATPPFLEDEVLDPAEMLAVAHRVQEFNQVLHDAASRSPRIHLVDMNQLLEQARVSGRILRGAGIPIAVTNTFTGTIDGLGRDGIFSYAGVHPSDTGHAVIAHAVLEKLKADLAGNPRFAFLASVQWVDERAVYLGDPHRTRQQSSIVLDSDHVDAFRKAFR